MASHSYRHETLRRAGALRQQALVQRHRDRRPDPDAESEPHRHVALHLTAAFDRGHLDHEGIERGGADAERGAREHPVGKHDPAGGNKEQPCRDGEEKEGEDEGHAAPEGVGDPAGERARAELGETGGSKDEANAASVGALVVQEQGQDGQHAEMAGRPQQAPAGERDDVARERGCRIGRLHGGRTGGHG
jgi:hypothetical protein